jgi:hypothetical protein
MRALLNFIIGHVLKTEQCPNKARLELGKSGIYDTPGPLINRNMVTSIDLLLNFD